MTETVYLSIEELVELLPNPAMVDYQSNNAPEDFYTEIDMLRYARKVIARINEKQRKREPRLDDDHITDPT